METKLICPHCHKKVVLSHCEHCGLIVGKVYRRGGTTWCKVCCEAEGWPLKDANN